MTSFQILHNNDKTIHAVEWAVDEAKAVIVLVHGLGEHCRRYDHVAAFFNNNQIAMLGHDHSGHGKTPGKRGHAQSMEDLMAGVSTMLQEAKKRYPGKPVFLYGHSMGGNISLNFILRKKPEITGAIISGPHIRMVTEPSPLLVLMGRLVQKIYPSGTQSNGLDVQMVSRDPEVIQQYIDDPLVHDRISYSLAVAVLDGAKYLNNYKGSAQVPILLMHGGADVITSPAASKDFASRISSDITHKEWSGFYHEIHNEKEQEKVFTFTLDWITERLRL
ncbi:MAG: alpha-beta hydrolase superfamily lysophospholipase [Polaribacter sp.]|jgi:alpha-beta hydrolase superfamily lysophospholipase